MKKMLLLLIATALFSCTDQIKQNKNANADNTATQITVQKKTNVIKGDDKDTVNISTDDSTFIKLTKGDLKRILKTNPELNNDIPYSPDVCWGESLKSNDEYNCEACRDQYYALYAYFLRSKNGGAKCRQQRKKLIELYRRVNHLFDILDGGSTYYGHQYTRILGYAEYSIYINKNNDYYIKSYNIVRQKGLYIESLKQLIEDEVNNAREYSPDEKEKKKKELFKDVNNLNRLVTTCFYLKMAQEFQY